MAFERPTLSALITRVEGDIKGALSISTILRRSFLGAIARAMAGLAHTLHGHMVFISKQIFPDQAEAEYLDRWGSLYGLERNPATFAELEILITFTAAGTVPVGTIFQRVDSSEYVLTEEVSATGAGTEIGVIRSSEIGESYNLEVGDAVSLQSAIANVEGDATVSDITVEGEDEETDAAYRQRLVSRIQEPPAGGTVADYKAFALSVTGVSRAWVFPAYRGEGTVDISFLELDGDLEVIPGGAKVDEVQAAIDAQKPVTANSNVFAPIENAIDFTIAISPNTAAVRAAVESEITDLFIREAEVRGAYKSTTENFTGRIPLSRINEAISLAEGEEDHVIISPAQCPVGNDPVPATNGGILTVGTVTFQTL